MKFIYFENVWIRYFIFNKCNISHSREFRFYSIYGWIRRGPIIIIIIIIALLLLLLLNGLRENFFGTTNARTKDKESLYSSTRVVMIGTAVLPAVSQKSKRIVPGSNCVCGYFYARAYASGFLLTGNKKSEFLCFNRPFAAVAHGVRLHNTIRYHARSHNSAIRGPPRSRWLFEGIFAVARLYTSAAVLDENFIILWPMLHTACTGRL